MIWGYPHFRKPPYIYHKPNHRCPFPIGWLMKKEGFEESPSTALFDDRWYTQPARTYFYQKDIIDHGGNPHQLVDITPMNTIVYLHISTIYLPYVKSWKIWGRSWGIHDFFYWFDDLIESNRGQCNVIKLLGDYRTYIIINLVQEKIKKG